MKRLLNLLTTLILITEIFHFPVSAKADVKMPLEVSIRYIDQPVLGHPVKIQISAKPLVDGESLQIKLIIPDKRIVATNKTYKNFKNPVIGQSYTLTVELLIPDGKVYQIIAEGYLIIENQVYPDSCVMNIDLGKSEAPEYPLVKSISPDGVPIIGVVGKQWNKSRIKNIPEILNKYNSRIYIKR